MTRRNFTKSILAASSLTALTAFSSLASSPFPDMKKRPRSIKPTRLKKGDTIGLVAPGSSVTEEQFQKAVQQLKALGFKVKYTDNILARKGYLAGNDEKRLQDLHQMFADKTVQGIWCIRGGYGSGRLLNQINYKLIKKNPKVLIGYSDITALIQAIQLKTGLIGFHGPVAVSDFNAYTIEQLKAVVINPKESYTIPFPKGEDVAKIHSIRAGKAQGCLVGGNLSLLSALAGTKYQWQVKGKILFIEDVGEKPYRIDRMLTQLLQSAPLHKAAAIVLGTFANCEAKASDRSLSLSETLQDRLYHLGIPVVYGLPFGHIDQQCTLPIGIKAEIDTQTGQLRLLENAVV